MHFTFDMTGEDVSGFLVIILAFVFADLLVSLIKTLIGMITGRRR